ncbi:MAG: hypothetical protein UZ03_NOB001001141 [Nitrospira sp. OLB3]|nr:MAG: hypothetical protein UZ03_NOB001001141 [Nitrospira sp. OLB3]RIK56519.1 MAG: hypothetical protein DCC63_17070 [Nitrospira sp.]
MPIRGWRGALLWSLVGTMVLTGCNVASLTINTPLTVDHVAFITEGRTTLTDVVERLGAPDSMADSEIGTIVTYRFLNAKYSRVNFGWLLKPFSPVDPDLVFSRSGLGTDAYELICNENWVVIHQAFVRQPPAQRLFTPYPF